MTMAQQQASLLKRNLDSPDETRDLSGMGEVEVVKIGDLTVSRNTVDTGSRWCGDGQAYASGRRGQ